MGEEAPVHWADAAALNVVRRKGDKETYVVAGGVTPSGAVHFGNFREVVTAWFVARALRDRGKGTRFILSWDDFDVFRKVPGDAPGREALKEHLRRPLADVPDPSGREASYAAWREAEFERQLARVGVEPEYVRQAERYRAGDYADGVRLALERRAEIAAVLDRHRKEPLDGDHLPVGVYCAGCGRDTGPGGKSWDGERVRYRCGGCGHEGEEAPEGGSRLKLPWRVDWPMRWARERVDFEPGGKDHSSEGGSLSTAREIVRLFGWEAPCYLGYGFVSVKGLGGKMSSSAGGAVTLDDVLRIYPPGMVLWIFASHRPNVDFAVSFDLDVLKVYEDHDRQEALAYGGGDSKKARVARRAFELASPSPGPLPARRPARPPFRHLANVLQIHGGGVEAAMAAHGDSIRGEADEESFRERAACAWNWLADHAPEEFRFRLNERKADLDLSGGEAAFLARLKAHVAHRWDETPSDGELHARIHAMAKESGVPAGDAFRSAYRALISKDRGPRLASFIRTAGRDRVLALL